MKTSEPANVSLRSSLGYLESQKFIDCDQGGDVGKLSQDIKAEGSYRLFHIVFLKSLV